MGLRLGARVLVVGWVIAVSAACRAAPLPADLTLRDGDIVFQHSRSAQSKAVALATRSEWTHMGLVWIKDGEPWVLEAIQPVKLTPLADWAARGIRGRLVIKRLREAERLLTPASVARLHELGAAWLGRPYDPLFQWDDDRLYCSELVYKLLDRAAGVQVGELRKAKDFNLASPDVQRLMAKRFGRPGARLNPEETVVSPQQIFEDPKLVTVFEN
jgi:hypothetical protein